MNSVAEGAPSLQKSAVERLGREVIALAGVLNHRLDEVESSRSARLRAVADEMARLEGQIGRQIAAAEQSRSDALDRLTREARAASQAIDALGRRIDTLGRRLDEQAAETGRLEARLHEGLRVSAEGLEAALGGKLEALAARLEHQAGDGARLEAVVQASEARAAARIEGALAKLEAATAPPRPRSRSPKIGAPGRAATAAVVAGAIAAGAVGSALLLKAQRQRPEASATRPPPSRESAFWRLPFRSFAWPEFHLQPPRALPKPSPSAAIHPRPAPAAPGRAQPVPKPAADAGPSEAYSRAVAAVEAGEPQAMARLMQLAQAGDGAAGLYLARLYESGAAGMPKDLGEARRWTERAADEGERAAMHNYALYLMRGEGGPTNVGEAARWFHKAAVRGVIDSQFNLGLLYEAGRGVEKNLLAAYEWYSIAANAGDTQARERAVGLEKKLTPKEIVLADQAVSRFRPGAELVVGGEIIPPATTPAESQMMLARLGYYIGPTDGGDSPEFRAAVTAYRRDNPAARPALGAAAAPRPNG